MKEVLNKWLFDPVTGRIILSLVLIVGVFLLSNLIQRFLGKHIQKDERRYHFRKIFSAISYLLIVFLLSIVFSDKLSGLTVAFGVAGAGIAFALQEVIASVAGWFALSFGRFYQVGDRVELGGIKGDVIDIGIVRTTIMECGGWIHGDLYNGRIVRVANSFIFKEPVFNYSADFPFLWDEIVIPVRYGSDYKMARTILKDALEKVTGEYARESLEIWATMNKKYLIENACVEPMVTMICNDNWAEFTLRYVVDFKKRRATKDSICEIILEKIEQSKSRVLLGSATFELTAWPEVKIAK